MISNLPIENNEFVGCGIGFATAKRDMNIRMGANVSDKIVGFLPKRAQVEVLEILPNGWYKITYSKIACGYAYVSNVSDRYFSYKSIKAFVCICHNSSASSRVILINSSSIYLP